MSYRIDWFGHIAGGARIVVAYTLQGGTDQGAQFAQAIPMPGPYIYSLVSTEHTAELSNGKYTYYFWVRNERGFSTVFALAGGGV